MVTAVVTSFHNLISPFKWEGVFIPLLPPSAREIFQAPVPFIVGSDLLGVDLLSEISSNVCLIQLGTNFSRYDIDRINYIPTATPLLPISKRPDEINTLEFLQLPKMEAKLIIEQDFLTSLTNCQREIKDILSINEEAHSRSTTAPYLWKYLTSFDHSRCNTSTNNQCIKTRRLKSLLQKLGSIISSHNMNLCSDILKHPTSYLKFGKQNNHSGDFEFIPEYFMEMQHSKLKFQENLIHTQLFVSHLEKKRKDHDVKNEKGYVHNFNVHFIT